MWTIVLLVPICGLAQGLLREDPPLASTSRGLIRGLRSEHGHSKFLGVPYAVVNETNPFGPSIPHPGFNNIFNAYKPTLCPQVNYGVAVGTIQCLSMNIYVPRAANTQSRLPVMVWIHGGSFVEGSSDREGNNPISLLKHNVVVVAINYRLGIYGFMCLDHPEVSGNQGLKDQVIALRWIRKHIKDFGGDARRVTLFGVSAGGMSINLHLLTTYEKLFDKVIIQSGPALNPWLMMETNNTVPLWVAKELGYNTTDVNEALAYLSTVEGQKLAKVTFDLNISSAVNLDKSHTKPCIEKKYDGVENFITAHPMNVKPTKVNTTQIIFGTNDNEFAYLYQNAETESFITNHGVKDLLGLEFNFDEDLANVYNNLALFYTGEMTANKTLKSAFIDIGSDYMFVHPTQRMIKRFQEYNAKKIYRYLFSYSGGRNFLRVVLNLNSTGATHADELGYLFDLDIFGNTSTNDQLVIDRVTALWTNFAKYGDPTPVTSELLPVKWKPLTKTMQSYLEINSELTINDKIPFQKRMEFWDQFYKLYEKKYKWYKRSRK